MTTKPKAERYRIRRNPGSARVPAEETVEPAPEPIAVGSDVVGNATSPDFGAAGPMRRGTRNAEKTDPPVSSPTTADNSSSDPMDKADALDEIAKEGLTGRQLRLARRSAQKHKLKVDSDFDAVRQLRLKGIDPFQRINVLELVEPNPKSDHANSDPSTGPAAKPQKPDPSSAEEVASPMQRRVREVAEIQKDIARRRRRKSLLLLSRLAFFVLLPAIFCGYYFYFIATPMFTTKAAFLILKADGGAAAAPSLIGSSPLATAQDAVAVQDYLTSKDAFIRLDEDLGFVDHFSQDWIDPIQRLSPDATHEVAHKLYRRNVIIGFDPTEGVIRMQVTAADPETSAMFSERLIQYAEARVDSLSQRKRENQLKDAERNLAHAQNARRDAQERLVQLQLENQLIDPEGEIMSLRTQISTFETQLLEKQLELQALLDNTRPNQARVDGTKSDIARLENTIGTLRTEMNSPDATGRSLADLAAQVQLAQADLATRDLMLSEALAQLGATRREAASQVRYLTTSVLPVASQDPSYPRKFENTVLSFLIFAGIYLMLSLTASILREQVSS